MRIEPYYASMAMRALESSGSPERVKKIAYNSPDPYVHIGLTSHGSQICRSLNAHNVFKLFAIFAIDTESFKY